MDGQYGNVTYICSATDECNPKELWSQLAQHADEVPGRRECLQVLFDRLEQEQAKFNVLSTAEDRRLEQLSRLKEEMDEHKKLAKKDKREVEKLEKDWKKRVAAGGSLVPVQVCVAADGSVDLRASTDAAVRRLEAEGSLAAYGEAKQEYDDENGKAPRKAREFRQDKAAHDKKTAELQCELNPLVAKLRNEYAAQKLQVSAVARGTGAVADHWEWLKVPSLPSAGRLPRGT